MRQPRISDQLIGAKANRHRAAISDRVPGVLDQLSQKTCAVFEAPSIFVDAVVFPPLKELMGNRQIVRGVDVDDIEPGFSRANRGVTMPSAQVSDVLLVHGPSLNRVIVDDRTMRRRERSKSRTPVRDRPPVMHYLDRGKRSMLVHCVGHQRHGRDVPVIPQPALMERLAVGGRMDLGFLSRNDGPAAFGLYAAQPCERLRLGPADAGAVWHLVETISRSHRPDAYRLEQHVVARVASHEGRITSIVSARRSTIISSSSSATLYGGANRMWSPRRPSTVPPPG